MNNIRFVFTHFFLFPAAALLILLLSAACGKKTEPPKSRISLTTEPEGATVSICGIERGKTPLKGTMKPGTYLIKFSMPGYKNQWKKLELTDRERKELKLRMEPETAAVLITSSPNAAVRFQGRNLGSTPVVIPSLPHGHYTAELSRHGFNNKTASWTIDSSIPKSVKINLDSNLGILQVTSRPSNAEVLLNGKVVGRTPFKDQLQEGEHILQLRRSGYVEAKKNIRIASGKTTSVPVIVLEIKSGSIQISSKPSGAKIMINGKHYGDTPFKLSDLKPGPYSIQLEKEGFDPAVRTVNLPPGENLDLMLNLDSNTGGMDIITQPPGLTLYLDGKMIGVSETDPQNKNFSRVFKVRNLSMGKHRLTIAHKRARPEKRNFTFTIEKGKTVRPAGLNLWIPNAVIVRDNGTVETGRIIQNLPSKYEFEPSPGVKYTIEKSTVKKVDYLADTE